MAIQNRIIKSCMNSFLSDYRIEEKDESVQFEHFVNFCIVSKYQLDAYQDDPLLYEAVHTGQGGDFGIDGLLVLVNDNIVTNKEQFEGIVGNGKFNVKIVFVQSKTSSTFDSGDMLKMGNGITRFFDVKPINGNPKITKAKVLMDTIFEKADRFEKNPECYIYYVTTGKWTNDENLVQVQRKIIKDIEILNITSRVDLIPVDADKLHSFYREVTLSIVKNVPMEKTVAFPAISGVKEAYLGLLSIKDLLNLICDDDGVLQNALFYENVRGFLGYNPVNEEIWRTLVDGKKSVHFPILNNGITIVARTMNRVGDNFTISDFQVVNGCQTCNVIYSSRNDIKNAKNIFCSIKLISTDDPEFIIDIIKSTNKQTQVLDEAFESLKDFHKKLQAYYETYDAPQRLYYERRSREFNTQEEINRKRIVTLTMQIKSYLSMFLLEPQSTHRYYGELLSSYRKKLFVDSDKLILYYTAAWCLYRTNEVIFSDRKYSSIKKFSYHIIMLVALLAAKRPNNFRPNSGDAEKYCNKVLDVVNDDAKFTKVLAQAAGIIASTLSSMGVHKSSSKQNEQLTRQRDFTIALMRNAGYKVEGH